MRFLSKTKEAQDLGTPNNDGKAVEDAAFFFKLQEEGRFDFWGALLRYVFGPLTAIFVYFLTNGFKLQLGKDDVFALICALISYVAAVHLERFIGDRQDYKTQLSQFRKISADLRESTRTIQDRISESTDHFSNLMSSINISIVDEADRLQQISGSLESSFYIRNTFVNLSGLTGTNTAMSQQVVKRYEAFLQKGVDAQWHDIVGLEDFFDGRYSKIFAAGNTSGLADHRLFILNSQSPVPILNFMLCANRSREFTDLYFGWIANMSNAYDVYHTKDRRLLAFFSAYFDFIQSGSRTVEFCVPYGLVGPQRFSSLIFSRVIGRWLSVSRSQKDLADKGQREYAILEIAYDQQWKVSGKVYSSAPGGRATISYLIKSLTCSLVKHSLYYSYERKDEFSETKGEGIGGYSISERADDNIMHGFYHMRSGKKHETYAAPISQEEIDDPERFSALFAKLTSKFSRPGM